jgi:hypothetical protein
MVEMNETAPEPSPRKALGVSVGPGVLQLAVGCLILFAWDAKAATNRVGAVDSGGGRSTNASYRSLGAIGQGVESGRGASGNYISISGYLDTFIMRPDLDTDGDGIADENDQDDDNDGLTDIFELFGTAFSPATPTNPRLKDSDGDGASDGAEALAGTDPLNAASVFRIESVSIRGGRVFVFWSGTAGHSYNILKGDSVDSLATNPTIVSRITVTNGSGLWQETGVLGTDSFGSQKAYYRIRLEK